jgi:hypothetical protein
VQAKKEAADAEAEALEGGGEAEGFRFGRLLERKPEARPELLAFRDALLASANQEQKLKVGAVCMGPLSANGNRNIQRRASRSYRFDVSEQLSCADAASESRGPQPADSTGISR